MPQFFKENNDIVSLCIQLMTPETVHQYQVEERTLMARRIGSAKHMTRELLETMRKDKISVPEKVIQLREELSDHYKSGIFLKCQSMGDLVKTSLKEMLRRNKQHIYKGS
jgi:hypothetical protein